MKRGEDYAGVSIVYFCHDGNGRYLFNKRSNNCRDEHGCWDCGGGGLEHGDTIAETLLKEIKEEYLADVIEYDFLGYRDMHREHAGKKTHWVALDFRVLVNPDGVGNGEPHKFDAVEWFRIEDLPMPRHSALDAAIEKYRDIL